MGTELGVGYLSLLPSMRDFAPAAKREASKAGDQAGKSFDAGFAGALRKSRLGEQEVKRQAATHKQAADNAARNLAVVGTAAAVGVGAGIKAFANFDKSMSDVRAATHETAGGMEDLRQAAIDAGADTAFSATEAAGGIENLAKAGLSTKDILTGGLAGALDLAAAGGLGVADAAETAATALTQFKLKGSDVPHVADLLSAAAGKAQGEVSDMSQALNQSGLVASQMGLSIEETTGTLAAFASAGLLGSDAGTSFKTMLLQLANPSGEASELMQQLGIHAYDAKGGFVGVGQISEQLKTKLGGLSQAQRDSALATIFGSDAIRAANVLYTQGAQGIDEWITKVDDAGFAAETAAIKQDNLRGDVEKLGGSFETALIKSGSGANSVLRTLTQTAGLAVDGFGKLPDEISAGVTVLGSVAAIGGLAAAGLLKGVGAARDLKDAWVGLGRTGRGLTLSMGGLGIALTAAAVIYGVFTKRNEEAKQKADDLRSTLDETTGAITANTRATVAKSLADSGALDKAKALGINLASVTDAVLNQRGGFDQLVGSLDRTIAAGTRHVVAGNRAATALTEEARTAQALKNQILGLNGSLESARTLQQAMSSATTEHKSTQQLMAATITQATGTIDAEKQSLDTLLEALHRASGAALSLSGAHIAYQAAVDQATASAKEHGRTLNLDNDAGRANRTTLDALARSANEQTDAMLRNGKGNDAARAAAQQARTAFAAAARQMGVNKTNADKMARAYIDVPDKVVTGVSLSGLPTASQKLKDFVTSTNAGLDSITDEAVTVSLFTKNAPGGHVPVERWSGGPIPGWSPNKTADNVLVAATAGEHMWTVDEVAAAGGHRGVEAIRALALSGAFQGLATGGGVGIGVTAATQSLAGIHAVTSAIAQQFGAEIARQRSALPLGWAQGEAGKPYIWGGVGPAGYDCSGFMSAITNVILGRNPHSRLFATGGFPTSMFAAGYGNFSIGSFRGNPGHMAGTLNGVNVESRGGDGVVIGAGARGAADALFGGNVHHLIGYAQGGEVFGRAGLGDLPFDVFDPRGKHFDLVQPKVFDNGGRWDSGVVGVNLSGQPETVRNAEQEAGLSRPIVIHNHIEVGGEVVRVVRTEIDGHEAFRGTVGRMR